MDINTLWNNGSESDWKQELADYYDNPTVKRNIDIENRINAVVPSAVMRMSTQEFYRFLFDEYFVWKYTAKNRLATTRKSLEKYETEGMDNLADISCEIFRLFKENPDDTSTLMKAATRIKGLGTAGASGLLAILFPEHYGTVDQFTVYALRKVAGLPEHDDIDKMKPDGLKIKDSVMLEDIYRRKARELNDKFQSRDWTPRKIDMILWAADR